MINKLESMEMPVAETGGFIRTLNQMGFMTSHMDWFSNQFVNHAAAVDGPVLEIGAAYGIASIAALEKGATVFANDIDDRHLQILWDRTPERYRENLTLVPGKFPEGLAVADGSFDAVLICRVLHFFERDDVVKALEAIYRYLRPNGKLFLVADSPYLRSFVGFHSEYESRKRLGRPWPGMIENLSQLVPHRAANLPQFFHALDPDILTTTLERVGFQVERAELFSQDQYPEDIRYDGREGVGVVARKS